MHFGVARALAFGASRIIAAAGFAGVVSLGAFFVTAEAQAQTAKADSNAGFQKGKVLVSSADVYAEPNFDSRVVGKLKGPSQWVISKRIYGAFYLVKISKDRVGYVLDTQIAPLTAIAAANKALRAENAKNPRPETPKPEAEKPPPKKMTAEKVRTCNPKAGHARKNLLRMQTFKESVLWAFATKKTRWG